MVDARRRGQSLRSSVAEAAVASLEQLGKCELQPADDLELRAGEPLVMFLEHDRLVLEEACPVPRARLGRRAGAALWALRVFALIVSAIVIYTFVAHLGS